MKYVKNSIFGVVFFSFLFIFLFGCSSTKTKSSKNTEKCSFFSKFKKSSEEKVPVYYDFKDILIPAELKYNKKLSFIYKGPGILSGHLLLEGRVEMNSLVTFFINNMPKDGWTQVSVFKSPNSIILFKKANMRCIIVVKNGGYNTSLNIWVAPAISDIDESIMPVQKPADLQIKSSEPEKNSIFPEDEAYENIGSIPMD